MLRLVRDDDQAGGRLSLRDVPLGPWTGAEIVAWSGKAGAVWHADPECPALRTKDRRQTHLGPEDGTMADLALPDGLHCDPPGTLGEYKRAAEAVVAFDSATHQAGRRLRDDWLDLAAFDGVRLARDSHTALTESPLAELWTRCQRQRDLVCSEIRGRLRHRLPVMLAAAWVAGGRRSRQHDDRYNGFLDAAERECDRHDLSSNLGIRRYVNDNVLPRWLAAVAAGRTPGTAITEIEQEELERTRSLSPDASADFLAVLSEALTEIGESWEHLLEGIALAHPGEVVAVFHAHGPGLGWELHRLFDNILPCARIHTDRFTWLAGRVPAMLGAFLKERDRGLQGLVLEEEHVQVFDANACALFLRNLVTHLGDPGLADHVENGRSHPDLPHTGGEDGPPETRLHWQRHGFGTGFLDAGITREECLPALRAAGEGREIPRGSQGS